MIVYCHNKTLDIEPGDTLEVHLKSTSENKAVLSGMCWVDESNHLTLGPYILCADDKEVFEFITDIVVTIRAPKEPQTIDEWLRMAEISYTEGVEAMSPQWLKNNPDGGHMRALAVIRKLLVLHVANIEGDCIHCHKTWPCYELRYIADLLFVKP